MDQCYEICLFVLTASNNVKADVISIHNLSSSIALVHVSIPKVICSRVRICMTEETIFSYVFVFFFLEKKLKVCAGIRTLILHTRLWKYGSTKPVFFFSFFLWIFFKALYDSLTVWESVFWSFQNREKNTLQFPCRCLLLLPSRRLYLLRGELPNLLWVIDELEKVFFWWFGFSGHAELVVCRRLPGILCYMCVCCNRVTEERQALLGRVSEVNLEFLDQRSVWFYIGNFLLVLHLCTHLFLLKNRTKTWRVSF